MVRKARLKDVGSICETEAGCLEAPWAKPDIESAVLDESYGFFVFTDGGEVKGHGSVKLLGSEAEICNIAVKEDFRRKGAATKLLEKILTFCSGAGAGIVFLEVAENNAAAKALYEKKGFTIYNKRKNYYPGGDALCMKKYLGIFG